jgi:hypothetical protein
MAVFITLGCITVFVFVFANLIDRSGGIQIIAATAYTFAIPWMTSDRFLNLVPWNRLIRGKVLLVHCLALLIVYSGVTAALALEPRLPGWFLLDHPRRGSYFSLCLFGVLLLLAYGESRWVMRPTGNDGK